MLSKLSIQLFCLAVIFFGSCHSNSGNIIDSYNSFKFDKKIVEKLPVYDSIASVVLQHIHLFKRNTGESSDFHGFRFRLNDKENKFNQLPALAAPAINSQIALLGNELMKGFDVFKDSSIKIYLRSALHNDIETEENLSFYPPGKKIIRREPPIKDTVLNERCIYWARFNNQGFF